MGSHESHGIIHLLGVILMCVSTQTVIYPQLQLTLVGLANQCLLLPRLLPRGAAAAAPSEQTAEARDLTKRRLLLVEAARLDHDLAERSGTETRVLVEQRHPPVEDGLLGEYLENVR
jgi:hypothetical protein